MTTHVFDADNGYLDSDTVFGVKDSLVKPFRPAGPGDPGDVGYVAEMDFALAPAAPGETRDSGTETPPRPATAAARGRAILRRCSPPC